MAIELKSITGPFIKDNGEQVMMVTTTDGITKPMTIITNKK